MSAENEIEIIMDIPVAQDVEEAVETHEELTLEAVLTFTESLEAHDLVQLMERATDTLKKKLKTTKLKKVLNRPKRPDSIALQMTRAWIPYVLRHSMDNGWESFSITRTVKDKETGEETKEVEIRSGSIPNDDGYTFKDTKTGEQVTPAFIFEDTKKHMIFKDAMSLSSKLKYTDETKTTESELYQTFKSEFVPPSASASSEDDGESTTSSTSSRVVTRTAAEKAEEKARKAAEKAEEKERKRLEKEEEKARKAAEKEEEKERKRLEKEAAKAAKAAAKVVPIPKAATAATTAAKAASAADSKAASAADSKPATAAKPTTPTKPVAPAKAATAADSKAATAADSKAATAADSKAATAADSKAATAADAKPAPKAAPKAATAATASTTDSKAAAKPAAKKTVKAAPKKVEEWTIPNDGNVHPWTFKGVKYAVNYERHVWKMTEDEDLGDWVGLYVPEEDRIDETVPEPEYDE